MEEYINNGDYGVDKKQMQVLDEKQETYWEWP